MHLLNDKNSILSMLMPVPRSISISGSYLRSLFLIALFFLVGTKTTLSESNNKQVLASTAVYIVHSDTGESANKFLASLSKALESQFKSDQIKLISTNDSSRAQLDSQLSKPNSCALSTDSDSLAKILATRTKTPIFAIRSAKIDLDNQINKYQQFGVILSGIYHGQSFARQLMLAKAIDDKLQTATLILGRKTRYSLDNYKIIARSQNMDLSYLILKRNGTPHNFLSNINPNAKFIATIDDQHHYSSGNLQSLLITSYKTKIPIIGNKAADTIDAAIASVFTPLDQLMIETSLSLRSFCENALSSKVESSESYPAHYSQAFSVSINQQIANHLNYPNLTVQQLLQQILDMEKTKGN